MYVRLLHLAMRGRQIFLLLLRVLMYEWTCTAELHTVAGSGAPTGGGLKCRLHVFLLCVCSERNLLGLLLSNMIIRCFRGRHFHSIDSVLFILDDHVLLG